MKPRNNKFINSLLLLTAICGILTWLFSFYVLKQQVPVSVWIMLAYIFALTFFIHRFLMAANNKRPQIFVASFMGSLTVKLFLSFGAIIIVRFADPANFKFAAVSFAAYYLLFTFIEIKSLLPHIRNHNG